VARAPSLIEQVTRHYLDSRDFNGLPVGELVTRKGMTLPKLRAALRRAIQADRVCIVFGDRHPNAHIKAFDEDPKDEQLAKLKGESFLGACVYPSRSVLQDAVDRLRYEGRPFSLRLALGAPQLEYDVFDLAVLEAYRNDPRYLFDSNDIGGHLSIRDKYFDTGEIEKRDEVSFRFGFAYSKKDMHRAVAAFLADLHDLSPEHQQMWNAKRLTGDFFPHPDWWGTSMGHWPERGSIFDALIAEFEQIAAMCQLIGWPPLFRETFEGKRPRDFGFLIRPTLGAFNSFVHLLDKMLSDNLSRDFFKSQNFALETEEMRKDGKVIVRLKGTLELLEEWVTRRFRAPDPKPMEECITALREVRQLRQKPAHAVNEDEFDQKYFDEQRKLVLRAYVAVRTLRLMLANHPLARGTRYPTGCTRAGSGVSDVRRPVDGDGRRTAP
jgi:hypothetical protein